MMKSSRVISYPARSMRSSIRGRVYERHGHPCVHIGIRVPSIMRQVMSLTSPRRTLTRSQISFVNRRSHPHPHISLFLAQLLLFLPRASASPLLVVFLFPFPSDCPAKNPAQVRDGVYDFLPFFYRNYSAARSMRNDESSRRADDRRHNVQ